MNLGLGAGLGGGAGLGWLAAGWWGGLLLCGGLGAGGWRAGAVKNWGRWGDLGSGLGGLGLGLEAWAWLGYWLGWARRAGLGSPETEIGLFENGNIVSRPKI